MAIEKKYVDELIAEAAIDVCWNKDVWDRFLKVCGNTYKYSFVNQLAIYAQRPDATFLCDFSTWNRMGRFVKKGSKGIRIVEKTRFFNGLYIFDARDTEAAKKRGRKILAWKLTEKERPALENYINKNFDPGDGSLEEKLIGIIKEISEENFIEYSEKIFERMGNDLTQAYIEKLDARMNFLTRSAVAAVFHRADLTVPDSYNMEYDFDCIDKPVNVEEFIAMGDVLAATTAEVLSEIERIIKKELAFAKKREYNEEKERKERRRENGTDIQTGRGLSDSESGTAGSAGGRSGKIRTDERHIPLRNETRDVFHDEHSGNIEGASDGSGSAGRRNDEPAAERPSAEESGAGQGEETGPVPGTYGGNQTGSGEHRTEGNRLYLTELPEDTIRQILTFDEFKLAKREELAGFFLSINDMEKRVEFVKNSFNPKVYSEFKIEKDGESVYAGYYADDRLLKLWEGIYNGQCMVLSWEKVTEYLDKYIQEERFLQIGESPKHLVTGSSDTNKTGIPTEAEQIRSIFSPELENLAKAYMEFSQLTDPYGFAENFPDDHTEEEIVAEIGSYLTAADRETLDEIIVKIQEAVQEDNSFSEKAAFLIEGLSNLLPNYQFYEGDTVYLDGTEYIILSIEEEQVTLYDTTFPLVNKVMERLAFIDAASTAENQHLVRVKGFTPENTLQDLFSPAEDVSAPFASEEAGYVEDALRFCGKLHLQDNLINGIRKGKSDEELAEIIKQNTFAAEGFVFSGKHYVIDKREDGLVIAPEKIIRFAGKDNFYSWKQIAELVRKMLDEERFLPDEKISAAEDYEYQHAAEAIVYMLSDLSDDTVKRVLEESLSLINKETGYRIGHEAAVTSVNRTLRDDAARGYLEESLLTLAEAYLENSSVMRFHWYRPDRVLAQVKELDIPKKEYHGGSDLLSPQKFICELEVEYKLAGGSNMSGSRRSIFEYFKNHTERKERESFLRSHFGWSGSGGPDMLGYMADAQGIKFDKRNCAQVRYKWPEITTIFERIYEKWKLEEREEEKRQEEVSEISQTEYEVTSENVSAEILSKLDYEAYVQLRQLHENQTIGIYIGEYIVFLHEDAAIAAGYEKTVTISEDIEGFGESEIAIISRTNEDAFIEFAKKHCNLCFVELADGQYEVRSQVFASEQEQTAQLEAERPKYPAINYVITEDDLGHGSTADKVSRNLSAIRILKILEAENRNATLEEQQILAQYIGWGGLPDVFDPSKSLYSAELKSILTESEYTAARDSVLNAHFTSPVIIRQMYRILDNLGFTTGNILEPSCGVGNFFGMLPEKFAHSRLYGVELDSVSARIAQKLYPNAHILQQGYETTEYPDNSFDVAIGNVPFGNYSIADKRYDRHGFKIHDYFFAKTIDQVRANGVIAFITSKGTMDKKSSAVRRYIAERCELLGAIRLPNTAFKKNAGTEVTSDILILQKRERPAINPQDEWLQLATDTDGLTYNRYFVEHPEMVLGEMKEVSGPFGMELTCSLEEPERLEALLSEAIMNIQGNIPELDIKTLEDELEETILPADLSAANFSYTLVENKIFYRENSQMREVHLGENAAARVRGMMEIRDITKELIRLQLHSSNEDEIKDLTALLNARYDAFRSKYGLINARSNELVFREDSSYPLICSLEELDDEGNFKGKADIFTKRTIRKAEAIGHVDECSEALALSLSEKGHVDGEYMAQLTGKEKEDVLQELCSLNLIFRDSIEEELYVTADEYLSGNVRAKLAKATAQTAEDATFQRNVECLQRVQPKPLDASEIEVRLGATWVPKDYYMQFMVETFQTPLYKYRWGDIGIEYSEATGNWTVKGKSKDPGNIIANATYGTNRANGYRILEDSLNLRAVQITEVVEDADGRERRIINQKETMLAQQKQDALKEAFKNWIFADPQRRQELCELYNSIFNCNVTREYDGEHLKFPGMNAAITLKPHQKRAVARQIYGGNTLLAHCVGAGKTYEMATAIMEKRRLGLCNKAMLVVPNHLTGQWASEFMRLYPTANILAVTKKDFQPLNRKKFCSRIATGDYDAIIIGHSQFEMIPISKERQIAFINDQLSDIETELILAKQEAGQSFTIKQLVKLEKELKTKLEKLNNTGKKDSTITFEELGVDFLCVDEAHSFKNLALTTKMRNVAGISTTGANKSYDMFAKCRYLDEVTGGKGITFATGTPVSNSMTELFTMQKYLQYDRLQQQKMLSFDSWASTYGETTQVYELAPEGTGYRQKTRFSKFFNLPELMTVFKDVADVQTSDMLDLPVPEAKYETVVLKSSPIQKLMLAKLADRADDVRKGNVESYEDNMLKITTDGRKLALDERLAKDMLTESEYEGLQFTMTEMYKSKSQACVEKCMKHYRESADQKGTQLIFSDLATPNKEGKFSIYSDVKNLLMKEGVPEDEIAFIHDYNTESKKEELFSKVRSGKVRFLLGSTAKMGAGMNVQTKLIAEHHLDVPWKPSDIEQREGRIIRQGNENKEVFIYRYVTENTFDAYSWQIIENKQKFIGQVMTSKSPVRSCDDIDETALSFAEVKALCTGNPLIKEKMELDNEVSRLRVLKSSYLAEHFRLEDELYKRLPERMLNLQKLIASAEADVKVHAENPIPENEFFQMKVAGLTYTEKKDAGYALISELARIAKSIYQGKTEIGEYLGFKLYGEPSSINLSANLIVKHNGEYQCEASNDPFGMITRINNILEKLPELEEEYRNRLADVEQQMENAKVELEKPFAREEELINKEMRLAKLEILLSMDMVQDNSDLDEIKECMELTEAKNTAIDVPYEEMER